MASNPAEIYSAATSSSSTSWNDDSSSVYHSPTFTSTQPYQTGAFQSASNLREWPPAHLYPKGKKYACFNCRQRKKRCNLETPSCSLCAKYEEFCIYPAPKLAASDGVATAAQHGTIDSQFLPKFAPQSSEISNSQAFSAHWDNISEASTLPPPAWDGDPGMEYSPQNDCQLLVTDLVNPKSTSGPKKKAQELGQFISESWGSLSNDKPPPAHASTFSRPEMILQMSSELRAGEKETEDQNSISEGAEYLPSRTEFPRLVETFFTQHHHLLPCIHRTTFLNRVSSDQDSIKTSPLVWVIIAVAASTNQNLRLRARGQQWFSRARSLLESDLDQYSQETQTLQASVWAIFIIYTSGDPMQAWLLMGRAYHLASAAGIDQIDRCHHRAMAAVAGTEIECEEQRKTMWALYILDRSISCLLPIPLIIDDRYFCINFPIDEESFQNCSSIDFNTGQANEPFTTDLTALMGPYIIGRLSSVPNIGHIYRAAILLGRIVSLYNQPHISQESKEHLEEFSSLERVLSLFDFALSRSSHGIQDISSTAAVTALWLFTLVQTCNILLFHPHITSSVSPRKEVVIGLKGHTALEYCNVATQSILRSLRGTDTCSTALSNPFILNACYLCCHLLLISSHDGEKDHREDVQYLLRIVKNMSANGSSLAQKFVCEMCKDAGRKTDELRNLRIERGCYIDHRFGSPT